MRSVNNQLPAGKNHWILALKCSATFIRGNLISCLKKKFWKREEGGLNIHIYRTLEWNHGFPEACREPLGCIRPSARLGFGPIKLKVKIFMVCL
jgi:hypothetical protein